MRCRQAMTRLGTFLFSPFGNRISTLISCTKDRFPPSTFGTLVLLTLAKPCVTMWLMSMETLTRAWEVLQDAYQAQMEGDYDRAIELYKSSLELHPTAKAHTFLGWRSEEHTSELQSLAYLVCRLLLEKKKKTKLNLVVQLQAVEYRCTQM